MPRTPGLVALAGCAFGAASCALVWGIDEPHPQADDAGTRVDSSVAETGDATKGEAGDGSAMSEGGDAQGTNDAGDDAESSFNCQSGVLDAGSGDASPPSCAGGGPGLSNCGPNKESCCANSLVPGGTFYRGWDKESYSCECNGATVSDFYLDKYEVTVGRFRKFVQATLATPPWHPCVGSGKHVHLSDGGGLNGGTESGWQNDWSLPGDLAEWNSDLSEPQCEFNHTWTPDAGANDNLPITCVTWYELYAFCIWDGGFLPTDAEWNYAAAGGSNQRAYPWSDPTTSYAIDCAHANVVPDSGVACNNQKMQGVGSLPLGVGQYSQFDLAGNVVEWVLDLYADGGYFNPPPHGCLDCALLSGTPSPERTYVGGSAVRPYTEALVSWRSHDAPTQAFADYGGRCARPAY
jgi:formylglycine-generating enzyme required for sulfatase activity